jgi:hypothetical protein
MDILLTMFPVLLLASCLPSRPLLVILWAGEVLVVMVLLQSM